MKKLWCFIGSFVGIAGFIITLMTLDPTLLGVWYYMILSACGLTFLICLAIALVFLCKNRHFVFRYLNYLTVPKTQYILKNKEVIYTFVDRTHMTLSKKFSIQSRVEALREFCDMYMWSKDYQPCVIESKNDDTITNQEAEAHWQLYCIRFDRFYGKNETHNTEIFMPTLHDPDKKSLLFLSTGIFEPTKATTLQVVINNPLKFAKGSTTCSVYHYYHGRAPDHVFPLKPKEINGGYVIEFTIQYPMKNARYKLDWKFEND
jgi:hypothetical protein